jgi:hypothetical protein
MLPLPGCDPRVNVVVLGARLIDEIRADGYGVEKLLFELPPKLKVSTDHIILTLDWLFAISVIDMDQGMVRIK